MKPKKEEICVNCGFDKRSHPISLKNGIGMHPYYICKKFKPKKDNSPQEVNNRDKKSSDPAGTCSPADIEKHDYYCVECQGYFKEPHNHSPKEQGNSKLPKTLNETAPADTEKQNHSQGRENRQRMRGSRSPDSEKDNSPQASLAGDGRVSPEELITGTPDLKQGSPDLKQGSPADTEKQIIEKILKEVSDYFIKRYRMRRTDLGAIEYMEEVAKKAISLTIKTLQKQEKERVENVIREFEKEFGDVKFKGFSKALLKKLVEIK